MSGSSEIDQRLCEIEPALSSAARWTLAWLVMIVPLPALFAGAGFGYLLIPVALAGVLSTLASAEPAESRRIFACLGIIGFGLSMTILLAVQWMQHQAGFVVLGPDGVMFLGGAQSILSHGFTLPRPSYEYFGTYGTSHYYLFAALMYWLGPTLFNLQLFNCAVAALLGPLTFSWVRLLYPSGAIASGVLVTLFPSIVYLAAVDLWKDASVIFTTSLALWALVHIVRERRTHRLLLLGVIAGCCFWYLHQSRFYPLVYIELGLLTAALLAVLFRQPVARGSVAAVALAVVLGEGVPAALGWPTSPLMFLSAVVHTANTPSMRYFTAGLLDNPRLADGDALGDRPRHKLEALPDFQVGLMAPVTAQAAGGSGSSSTATRSPSVTRSTSVLQTDIETSLATPATFGSVSWAIQIVRRLYGPFVWILPPSLSASGWLGGLYLMYPGMLFWYALFPWMLVGFAAAGWQILRGTSPKMLAVVWVFAGLYSLQFLAINLPFRQREAMFPVLVVFGVMGYHWTRGKSWWTHTYMIYWIGLALMAVAHLIGRARMLS